jgi:predicted DNA-binding transcriptional regulator AlpA
MTAMIDTGQIAEMLSVSREYVTDRLTKRADFPAPALSLSRRMRRWKESDVREWLAKHGGKPARTARQSRDTVASD